MSLYSPNGRRRNNSRHIIALGKWALFRKIEKMMCIKYKIIGKLSKIRGR